MAAAIKVCLPQLWHTSSCYKALDLYIVKWYFPVQIAARCAEYQENSPFYGRYSWPGSVLPEVTIKRNCSYSCGTLTGGVATRYCTGSGVWNSTNFDECPTRRTCDLVAFAIVSNSNQSFHNYILAGEICFKLYYLSLWIEFVYVYLMLFVLKILILLPSSTRNSVNYWYVSCRLMIH